MLTFVFPLVIIFSLAVPDFVFIDSLVESDQHYPAVDYRKSISANKNLGELPQLVNDLNKMEIKVDQFYEFYHRDILVVNDNLEFHVAIHYIDNVIWERINANSDLIMYNPLILVVQ